MPIHALNRMEMRLQRVEETPNISKTATQTQRKPGLATKTGLLKNQFYRAWLLTACFALPTVTRMPRRL